MKRRGDMQVGEKYGRLTVAEYMRTDAHPRKYFRCDCECGGQVVTHTNSLRTGNTRSCGCLSREAKKAQRLPKDKGVINHIILQYKRHASNRGLSFCIDYDEFEVLIRSPCVYCGIFGGNLKKTKDLKEGESTKRHENAAGDQWGRYLNEKGSNNEA